MRAAKIVLLRLFSWTQPSAGRAARDVVMLACFIQAAVRIFDGTGLQPVNFLPSQVYGWLMLLAGLALCYTAMWCQRGGYAGRISALCACALWLLLAADLHGAWASFGNALLFALIAGNEIRYRAC